MRQCGDSFLLVKGLVAFGKSSLSKRSKILSGAADTPHERMHGSVIWDFRDEPSTPCGPAFVVMIQSPTSET